MRPTRFELHILPLIRQLDRLHMQQFKNIDLWDYNTVSAPAMAKKILRAIQASPADVMPPVSHGGSWPEEWMQLFQRWVSEGYPRLGLGTANQITAERNGGIITLTADGAPLGANATAWLDRYTGTQDADFVLYQDLIGQGGQGQIYPVSDFFSVPPALQEVKVLDCTGIRAVAIV